MFELQNTAKSVRESVYQFQWSTYSQH